MCIHRCTMPPRCLPGILRTLERNDLRTRRRLGGERGLGAYGTPEILGNIVNPPSGGWEVLASQLADPRIGFDIAAHASGLGAPSFLRNELYTQQSRLQNQFQSQLSQGPIKDTLGADYFDYLRRQLGAA